MLSLLIILVGSSKNSVKSGIMNTLQHTWTKQRTVETIFFTVTSQFQVGISQAILYYLFFSVSLKPLWGRYCAI